jgi:hypothetical protein
MTFRKQPAAAFSATVLVVVVLVAYPLSIGPVCWLEENYPDTPIVVGDELLSDTAYAPVAWTRERSPAPVRRVIWRYIALFAECNPD